MKRNLLPLPTDVRDAIVAKARTYVGTPFRHQGRIPGRGLDCVGVIACLGRSFGLMTYDVPDYARLPTDGTTLACHVEKAGFRRIEPSEGGPGDVYLMTLTRFPQHVALVTDRGILHAWLEARAVVEHGLDPLWRSRISAVYRFPGVI